MSIYIELLERFSKVHDRKLTLLEQGKKSKKIDSEADKEAVKAKNAAEGKRWREVEPIQLKSGAMLKVWQSNGTNKNRPDLPPNGPIVFAFGNDPKGKHVDKNWDKFVAFFKEGEGVEEGDIASDTEEMMPSTPEEGFAMRQDQLMQEVELSQETKDSLTKDFTDIFNSREDIYNAMKDTDGAKATGSPEQYARYLCGGSTWSFQSALLAPKFTLNLEDGIWVSQEEPLQEAQTSMISRTFKDLLDFIVKSNKEGTDEKDCTNAKQLLTNFYKTDRNDIVIKGSGDASQGLAFDGGLGRGKFLSEIVDKAASVCGHSVATVAVRAPVTGTGNSNNVRGTGAEEILEIASLAMLSRNFGDKLPEEIRNIRTLKISALYEKLTKAKIDSEEWVARTQNAGIDPEMAVLAKEIYESFQKGADGKTLIESMMEHSIESLKIRRPKYAVPVGDQVGRGKRQDIFEVYESQEEAIAAARRSGLDISPVEMTVEEAFGPKKQSELDSLKRAGIFTEGQKISVVKVSLKNYMSLNYAKYGGGSSNTFAGKDGLMRQSYTAEPLMATIASNLEMSSQDKRNMKEYFSNIDKIAQSIFDVPNNVMVTTSDGKKLNARGSAQETFAKSVLEKLSDLGYSENPTLKNIMDNCRKVIGKIGNKYELNAAIDSLKNQTVTWLQSEKLSKDLNSKDPITKNNAQMFLAHKMFHAGGSDDNNLLCDYRDLINKTSYQFRQNDPLRDAWRSVLNRQADSNGNTWDLLLDPVTGECRLTSNKLEFKLKNNYTLNRSSDTGRVKSHHTNFILEVNRAIMELYNRRTIAESTNQELGVLLKSMGKLLEKIGIAYS